MAISAAKAKPRGKIAALSRAVRNGERQPNDPELRAAYRDLAVATINDDAAALAEKARKLVADWPDLTAAQLGRVARILKAASADGGGA